MFKLPAKLAAAFCGAAILFAGGCDNGQKTDAEIEQLRSYTEQRFNDLQAHLTVLSEQIDREQDTPAPVTLQPSTVAPALGGMPVVQITDIEPVGPESYTRRQQIAQLSQPLPTSRKTTTTRKATTKRSTKKSKYSKIILVSGVTARDLQTALKNAGFNPGKVDGKMGPNTVRAIKQFQAAEKLKVDGIVGSQTWGKLVPHLSGAR